MCVCVREGKRERGGGGYRGGSRGGFVSGAGDDRPPPRGNTGYRYAVPWVDGGNCGV